MTNEVKTNYKAIFVLFYSCRLLIISCNFLALTRALEILFAEQQKQKFADVFQKSLARGYHKML